jgi:ApaG protein
MYTRTTAGVTVSVRPSFLESQSIPEENYYIWLYHINIFNSGEKAITLLNRYWRIIDSSGKTEEVRGHGVIGEQPMIASGGVFDYTSGVTLRTPSGFMTGHYEMQDGDGHSLVVSIPAFSLDSPHMQALSMH